MIYLKNTTERQTLYIPRMRMMSGGDLFLKAKSRMESQELSFPCEDDMTSILYHKIAVTLPDGIADGEYDYILDNGLGESVCGLLVIGELDKPFEYDNTIEYEQYD